MYYDMLHQYVFRSLMCIPGKLHSRTLVAGSLHVNHACAVRCSSPREFWGSYRTPVLPAMTMQPARQRRIASMIWTISRRNGFGSRSQDVVRFIKLSLRLISSIIAFDFCLKSWYGASFGTWIRQHVTWLHACTSKNVIRSFFRVY